jgi:copper resistance protein D
VDTVFVFTRILQYTAATLLQGIFVMWCVIAQPALRQMQGTAALARRFDRWLLALGWTSLLVALASGIVWLIILASQMSGMAVPDVIGQGVVRIVLTQTQFGKDWLLRGACIIVLAACLLAQTPKVRVASRWTGLVVAAIFMASLAWAGHAAADDKQPYSYLHLPADLLHLLATGAWLGALLPLGLLLAAVRRDGGADGLAVVRAATSRFSVLGVSCVGTLLVTGIVNTWFLSGSIPALVGTLYGQLLLVKIALFFGMIAVANVNRNRLLPVLAGGNAEASLQSSAVRKVRRNAFVEAGLGVLVLAVVGIIGRLPPGLHTEPVWPFSFQVDLGELGAVALKVLDVAAILFVLGLIAIAIQRQRRRGVTLAAVCVVLCGSVGWIAVRPGIQPAYPTTYYAPTQPYAAASVARGATLYAANCTACHGVDGRGGGPMAARLPIRPADLTEHIFAHHVGDLFWWVSQGRDNGVMPGFAAKLSPDQRWDVINFVLARAAAVQTNAVGSLITTAAAPPLPDFDFQQDGAQNTLSQMVKSGPVLLVLFAGPSPEVRLKQLTALKPGGAAAGLGVIAVGLGNMPDKTPTVVQVSTDVRGLLMLFRSANDGGETDMILDRNASVRARWTASGAGGLPAAAILLADAVQVARIPAAAASHAGHGG